MNYCRPYLVALLLLFTSLFTPANADGAEAISSAGLEPTDLEKNSAMYGLLQDVGSGVADVEFAGDGTPFSASVIGKSPMHGNASRESLRAIQQAAIWSACAEFAKWRKELRDRNSKVKENPNSSLPAGSTERTELAGEELLEGLRVVHLDVDADKVIAVLRWKAVPTKSEKPLLGTLPRMKVRWEDSSENKLSESGHLEKMITRIYINEILVLDDYFLNVEKNDGTSEATFKSKVFFESGKPNLEETVTGTAKGQSIEGVIWDESGKKTKYRK